MVGINSIIFVTVTMTILHFKIEILRSLLVM